VLSLLQSASQPGVSVDYLVLRRPNFIEQYIDRRE